MASEASDGNPHEKISTELLKYRPIRHQRYAAVHVRLISWKDDDTESATEIKQLKTLFQDSFNYAVIPYLIPSIDSQTALNLHIANFLHDFGKPDNLLIIYYGGHGGPTKGQSKSPCTWAATNDVKGPCLDWSKIQPSLLNADCDVVIILDCCYAGQAAKSISARTIELLAATDQDQWVPSSKSNWRTFTQALTEVMEEMLKRDGIVTLVGLAKYLSASEARLLRQPFHICLGGDHTVGPIKLAKLAKLRDTMDPHGRIGEASPAVSFQLKFSFFEQLNSESVSSFVRWMTRDSPKSIENVQYVGQELTEVDQTGQLCNQLLDVHSQAEGPLLPCLSKQGQAEGLALLSHLRSAMSSPISTDLTDVEAIQVIRTVKSSSQKLVEFIEDSLSHLKTSSLLALESDELLKAVNPGLRERINMRLTLIAEDIPDQEAVIAFDATERSLADQRFRTGSKNGNRVLVEYFYYDDTDKNLEASRLRQVQRISALHTEAKGRAFHSMRGVGFLRESLRQIRYGIVYRIPEERRKYPFSSLSDLISKVRTVPLEIRMRTAYALCEALLNLHSIGWYHKAIKSENILIFGQGSEMDRGESSTAWAFHCPYLVGFDCSRPSAAETHNTVDFMSSSMIYRHPERWGYAAPFERHHDLYALGILLLEVGCWKSLKKMDGKKENFEYMKDPEDLRTLLLGSILDKTAHAAGTQFASAVGFCFERRKWKGVEEWQVQKMMRQNVLDPLRACCS